MPINRVPFNALIDDSGAGLDGSVWNKAAIKSVLLDPIDAFVGDVWIAYTPTYRNAGAAQPALGNGSLTGFYILIGKTIHFEMVFAAGTTTTFGEAGGFYVFGLPPFAVKQSGARINLNFTATFLTGAGSATSMGVAYGYSATEFYLVAMNGSAGSLVGPVQPFTWGNSCALMVRGTYQAP